ncbi:hypothetical protein AG1IA_09083 [Rhizoctonia solani AG-1 IA]|uniref:Uncharacterized protein n=1 Tax=Thanatephorus cucumeris (strain AG1-IA) TaxID=983506 RepID=L8WJI3_THACA|nr:hypothetical protein AG1IA_09083 [Rhizoctonia solani AG-1 IA]
MQHTLKTIHSHPPKFPTIRLHHLPRRVSILPPRLLPCPLAAGSATTTFRHRALAKSNVLSEPVGNNTWQHLKSALMF